jgi:hypothetical protein
MDIEIQGGARKTGPDHVLAEAILGNTSPLCYSLMNKIKIESNITLIKRHLK